MRREETQADYDGQRDYAARQVKRLRQVCALIHARAPELVLLAEQRQSPWVTFTCPRDHGFRPVHLAVGDPDDDDGIDMGLGFAPGETRPRGHAAVSPGERMLTGGNIRVVAYESDVPLCRWPGCQVDADGDGAEWRLFCSEHMPREDQFGRLRSAFRCHCDWRRSFSTTYLLEIYVSAALRHQRRVSLALGQATRRRSAAPPG